MLDRKFDKEETSLPIYRDQLITVSHLESFRLELLKEIKLLLRESPAQSTKQWLRSAEVRKMLGISCGTLQNLRVGGTLSYTKVGGIIFYKLDDIKKLLDNDIQKLHE